MTRRVLLGLILPMGFVMALTSASPGHRHEWEMLHLQRAPAGIRAPDFTLSDLEGRRVSLAELRGRLVVLNFWATWCVPCEMEMPSIQRLSDETARLGVVVLAVNLREPASRVGAFTRERRISFPVLLDPDGAVFSRYRVDALPFTVVIDARGDVRAVAEGPRDWASPEARSLLERLTSDRPRE